MGADWPGGYYCPCHNSRFDLVGARLQGLAGADQPDVPPHRYASRDAVLVIGEDTKGA